MRGLYLITNDDPFALLQAKLTAALATGQVALLQYRRKKVAYAAQLLEIAAIKALCQQFNTPFLINDHLDLAEKFALGVHLGQSDGEVVAARDVLPAQAIIGRTCLNDLALAEQAIADGVDYVAFGAVYATATKPEAGHVGLEVIRQAAQRFELPICAIGGLTVENAADVIAAGADLCAVISDILALDVEHIPARVQAWAALFAAPL
ncbi:thiamine phosphate synthase [Acinetobacter larvae]|uniref:Thiamine-phosphate synthase n=1 Tax=Acinetobacter larvae TaxID=1789224 RepID=A0A1B2M1C9_9GAMM|nr:thiamine phosphate synthase [Acinetobacter larvae]AOA59006.1 thiamine-phosphate diphosphorylase [Acinetobacter larvae]